MMKGNHFFSACKETVVKKEGKEKRKLNEEGGGEALIRICIVIKIRLVIVAALTCCVVTGLERERRARLVHVVAVDGVLQHVVGLHHGGRRGRGLGRRGGGR